MLASRDAIEVLAGPTIGRTIMASEQKVAVITGASQGIGASLVKGFREIGYGVVATSRSIRASEFASAAEILVIDGDIAAASTADRVVSAAIERFGRIDTRVNNAGAFIPTPFIDYSEADFMRMTAVNLAGFLPIAQETPSAVLGAGARHSVNITAA